MHNTNGKHLLTKTYHTGLTIYNKSFVKLQICPSEKIIIIYKHSFIKFPLKHKENTKKTVVQI